MSGRRFSWVEFHVSAGPPNCKHAGILDRVQIRVVCLHMCQPSDVKPLFCWFFAVIRQIPPLSCLPLWAAVFIRRNETVMVGCKSPPYFSVLYLPSLSIVCLPSSHSSAFLQSVALKAFHNFFCFLFFLSLDILGLLENVNFKLKSNDQTKFTNLFFVSIGFLLSKYLVTNIYE